MMISTADILEATGGQLVMGHRETQVTGLSSDSRAVKSGDVFFALPGERFDGHDFLRQVSEAGAAAVVISKGSAASLLTDYKGAIIMVADTVLALGDLAAWYRRRLLCRVIAITGSCGKTTVKEMIGQVLATRLRGVRPESSFNNFIGVPLTIFRAASGDDFLILELGSNAPGEMRRLSAIASADLAVVTCVGPSHLEGFTSLEGVAHEKEELVRSLRSNGVAILNADDPHVRAMAEAAAGTVRSYGQNDGDLVAVNVQCGAESVSFQLLDSNVEIRLPVPGRHNVTNALAAVAVAREMGFDDQAIAAALANYQPPKMRLVRQVLLGGLILIDDCYNANPLSSRAALEVLCAQSTKGRFVLVQGDMLELGPTGPVLHADLGLEIGASCVDLLVTVGQMTRETSLAAAKKSDLMRFHFGDSRSAASEVPSLLEAGDAVLVKGSRGMAMDLIVAAIKDYFAPKNGK